jgi:predicted AlkP superfamily pyrophosphatase or phosphodiesterase
MKFLRVLANSLIGGFYFCLLLALLVADLNINLVLRPFVLLKLAAFLMLSYGLLMTLAGLCVYYIYHFFTGKKGRTGFVSASFLTLDFSLLTLVFLIIFRENYVYFPSFFAAGLPTLLQIQMMALFLLATAGFVFHYRHHHRKPSRFYFMAFFVLFGIVMGLVFILRLSYPRLAKSAKPVTIEAEAIEKKITIFALDGLSLDFILPLSSERKLPNFTWLMEGGSWGRLENFTPNEFSVLDHSFNTGKFPGKHRLISEVQYRIPGIRDKIEIVPRFILFRQLKRIGLLKVLPNDPPPPLKDLWKIFEDYGAPFVREGRPSAEPTPIPMNPKTEKLFLTFFKDLQFETSKIFSRVKQAFSRDSEAEEKAWQIKTETQPRLFSLFLDGLNTAETYFYKYSFPDSFGEIRQEEIQKYGPVIEKYYQFYDQIIGKHLAALKEDELLVVYSPHGIEPLPFWKRLVEWILGNASVSSYHEEAPDGAIFFYGKDIARGKNIEGLKLVDVLPSLLYSLGLPVGKDMDGIVRGSLFLPVFTEENPIFYITSYEDVNIRNIK